MGSAFLSGVTGIEPATLDNAAAYLAGWLKTLRGAIAASWCRPRPRGSGRFCDRGLD